MSEDRTPQVPTEEGRSQNPWDAGEPALTPRGTPAAPPVQARRGDEIHAFPEMAVGEGDVRTEDDGRAVVAGTSLWKDAWRRLLRNKLAVFGMVVVALIVISRRCSARRIIKAATGYTVRLHPGRLRAGSVVPALHRAGRPVLVDASDGHRQRGTRHAGARAAGRAHLADGRHHLDLRLAAHRHHLRRDGRLPGRQGRRRDDAHRGRALRDPVHDDRHRAAGLLRRAVAACSSSSCSSSRSARSRG